MVTEEGQPTGLGDYTERNYFYVLTASGMYATNSGWVDGTDYTTDVAVWNQSLTFDRESELGVDDKGYKSTLCFEGDNVTVTYTPDSELHPNYAAATVSKTLTASYAYFSAKIPEVVDVTFVAPAGSVVDAGQMTNYFVLNFIDQPEPETLEDGRVAYTYQVPKSTSCFYRAQNPDGVTYWSYGSWSEETTVEITAENLSLNSDFTSDTVYRNYEKNTYDLADVYLSTDAEDYFYNSTGCLSLESGDSFELNAFRNWFAINSFMNDKIAVPDFDYEVVYLEGDCTITVEPDAKNSAVATVTAEGQGTAAILVTYDAMTYEVSGGQHGTIYSAIWPDRTGVLVVTIGNGGSEIDTGMTINEGENPQDTGTPTKLAGDNLDAEHDILFYLGEDGAEYSFKPENGCTVTVARSTVGEETLSFNGFTAEGVTVADDGTVTVSGLTTGRHIIRVEKDGAAAYQVITAQEVSYKIMNADCTEEATSVKPGDTVVIQFTGLTNPCEKLSGVYNNNANIRYDGEDGTGFGYGSGGFGVYGFSGNPVRQRLTVTIPEDWTGDTYTLTGGVIRLGGFGSPAGYHRDASYAKGKGQNFTASATGGILSSLPDITIELEKEEEEELPTVKVYFSVSEDDQFAVGKETGEVMALKEIEVPYFNLALYGLEDFYFSSEDYGDDGDGLPGSSLEPGTEDFAYGKVTMMHLFIYATEVYYCGVAPEEAGQGWLYESGKLGIALGSGTDQAGDGTLTFSGTSGSSFMYDFWNMDLNLNYYHNYEYPLASEGWGATSDQILLHDGDIVTLGHFTDWSFCNDPTSVFNYIQSGEDIITTTVKKDSKVTLTVYHAGAGENYTTAHEVVTYQPDVYIAAVDQVSGDVTKWTKLGTADENGQILVDTSKLEAGQYVVAVAGQYGCEYTDSICSTPGGILLNVELCDHKFEEKVTEADCVNNGYTEFTCAECGYSYIGEEIPALGHDFSEQKFDATCTTDGYTEHTCSVCKYVYRDEIVPATGHDMESVVTEPTHDEMGYTTYTCANEGCTYTFVSDWTDALDHEYVKAVTKAATCTEDGEMTFTCECGATYTQVIPKTGHSCEKTVVAPTCTEYGYTKYECKNCEHNYISDIVVPNCPSKSFTDVKLDAWYHEAVDYVVSEGLMNGTATNVFDPNGTTTRAQIATILYRIEGEPSVEGMENPFEDVSADAWYAAAVIWAANVGVVNGTSETTFAPGSEITREQMVTMLWRYAEEPEAEAHILSAYADADKVGDYAAEAFAWAISEGIVKGATETTLAPQGTATRAQIATILMRYLEQ